ncbi:rhodanese-like domain-containing protein [Sphingosinicella terrae]|uniref:rhodanese-like domain-containing protein n=1 Tax=Sphingosinicella terrae TaxID=2172047 RepID=UPI000E0D5D44|nr:rhodanese-like domain-containing protein [Sphingosinicella terrae]
MRLFALALIVGVTGVASAAPPTNPQIDYPGFRRLAADVESLRAQRLIRWDEFTAAAADPDVLILDARSAESFAAGHIDGAVNLPLPDFTAESLARVVGRRDRPILIYCNNNFRNDVAPVRVKALQLALNIQTFINLVGYGYANVSELGEVVDFDDPRIPWVRDDREPRRSAG